MPRAVWKGPFVDEGVSRAVTKALSSGNKSMIKIYSRRSVITPRCMGLSFGVYNGKKFVPLMVSEDHVGKKFGEFSPTRVPVKHAAAKKVVKK